MGTKGAGAGDYARYNTDYHNTKYFQGCTSTSDTDDTDTDTDSSSSSTQETETKTEGGSGGACYDMTVHQCSCDPGSCTAELCQAQDGIWTAECPNHCRTSDCQPPSSSEGDGEVGDGDGGVGVGIDDTSATDGSSSSSSSNSNGSTIEKSDASLDATTNTGSSGPQDNDSVVGSLAESSSSAAAAAMVVSLKKQQQLTMIFVVAVVANFAV